MWFNFLILFMLFLLSGFFSSTETALFSLSRLEKRRLQKKYPSVGKVVMDQLNHPRRTLTTLLVGNILVNTLASAYATTIILHLWGPNRLSLGIMLYTFFLIIICEITPKIVAARQNETLAVLTAPPLRFFSLVFQPLISLLQAITERIFSVMVKEQKEKAEALSEEELKTLVKIGEEEGVFDRQERHMMQKLFDLGERPVKEIMTPRVDMVALDIEDDPVEHRSMMAQYHFSHFPVYEDSPDHILGVLSVQEFLLNPRPDLKAMLRQPLFVPETKRIDDLLEELRKTKEIFAICVDEHGGTAGLVTLEDILEEIFGEYYDEYEKVENPIRSFGYSEYIVDAKIPISEFNEFFGVQLNVEEATTLGGFILEKLGEVPKPGQILELPEMSMRIKQIVRQRILSVIVRKRQ